MSYSDYCQCNQNPDSDPNTESLRHFSASLMNKYPVDLWLTRSGDYLVISGISVKPDVRGQGIGTQVVEKIVEWGHRQGLTIALTPEPVEKRGSVRLKNRLKRWYRRIGFVPNRGRYRDFRIRESMLFRPPKR